MKRQASGMRPENESVVHGGDGLGYEPPRVERVLSPEDLEREVLYAGAQGTPLPP